VVAAVLPIFAVGFGWIAAAGGIEWLAAIIVSLAGLFMLFGGARPSTVFATRIEIKADGIEIARLRRTFIPFEALADIQMRSSHELALVRREGAPVIIESRATHELLAGRLVPRAEAIAAAIEHARTVHHERAEAREIAHALGRHGRTLAEWLLTVRGFGAHDATYRSSTMREDDLWRVVEDDVMAPDARAAAAFLLAQTSDDATQRRLRVVTESIADAAADLESAAHEADVAALARRA
jgi:hypothetical protein